MNNSNFFLSLKICADVIWRSGSRLRVFYLGSVLLDIMVVILSISAPAVLKYLIDSYNSGTTSKALIFTGLAYGATWLASEMFVRIKAVVGVDAIEEIKKQVTWRLCGNTIFPNDNETPEENAGAFAARINQVSGSIPIFVDGLTGQVFPLIARLIMSVVILVQVVPIIYSIALSATVIVFACCSLITFNKIGDKQKIVNGKIQKTFNILLDILKNREITLAHGNVAHEMGEIGVQLDSSKRAMVDTVYVQQVGSSIQILVLGLGLAIITGLAAYDLSIHNITLGEFIQINAYLLQFVLPVSYFAMVISGIKRASVTIGASAHLISYYAVRESIDSDIDNYNMPMITIDNLCSNSPDGSPLLRNISLKLEPGCLAAIVGPSGGGKTSLLKAIAGLRKVSSGEVSITITDENNQPSKLTRAKLAYVPQDTAIFLRSVAENIADHRLQPPETATDAMNRVGLKVADPSEFLKRSAHDLSGGEKQRVAIARAISRNPKLLIMDEPTSSLDIASQKIINDLVNIDMSGMLTRVIVTHDLKQAMLANLIIVIENGKVTTQGSHFQLMQRAGWYKDNFLPASEPKDSGALNTP